MEYLDALKLLALRAVVRDEPDYNLRHVFRWYSKEFHTPLHVVDALPLEEVLQHYLETRYEDMEEEERKAEIKKFLTTKEELRELRVREDREEAELFEYAQQVEAQERQKTVEKKGGFAEAAQQLKTGLEGLGEAVKDLKSQASGTPLRDMGSLPPDLKMNFIEAEEFESLMDRDFVPNPKKHSG